MVRYVPWLVDRGAHVVLEIPAPLQRLLGALSGVRQTIAPGQPLPPYDYECPMMSLPLVFGTTLQTIPFGNQPYL